jgi:hypothetical protein
MNSDGKFSNFREVIIPENQNSALRVDLLLSENGQGFKPPKPVRTNDVTSATKKSASEATSVFSYLTLVVPSAFFALLF